MAVADVEMVEADLDQAISEAAASSRASGKAPSEWNLDPVVADVHVESWAIKMKAAFEEMLVKFGGPQAYLQTRLQSYGECMQWLQYVAQLVPLDAAGYVFSADDTMAVDLANVGLVTCP